MLASSEDALVVACRALALECKLLVIESAGGDPLVSTIAECWRLCRRAVREMRSGAPSAALTFLECCFACDDCADACEPRPDERARRCGAAFRRCAAVCWDLARQPDYRLG
jgi:hypothetical protein